MFKALSSNPSKVVHQAHYAFNLPSTWPGQALFDAVTSQKPRKILRDRTYLVFDCSPPWLSLFKPFPDFKGVRGITKERPDRPPFGAGNRTWRGRHSAGLQVLAVILKDSLKGGEGTNQ